MRSHAARARVMVDGAQAVPQEPVDVAALGADFYGWTGHKLYGPTGIGVLHVRRDLLAEMPPFLTGGSMITTVTLEASGYLPAPQRFEAGTQKVSQAIARGTRFVVLSDRGGTAAALIGDG